MGIRIGLCIIILCSAGCRVGQAFGTLTQEVLEAAAPAIGLALSGRVAQARLLVDLRCDTHNLCSDESETPRASECTLEEGPWRESARDALTTCAMECMEQNCAAFVAPTEGLSAPKDMQERCTAASEACGVTTDACDALAVVDGDTQTAIDACHTEPCETLPDCFAEALLPGVDEEAKD